jgi:hypothetical protein
MGSGAPPVDGVLVSPMLRDQHQASMQWQRDTA